jgi:hypothetical protein
VNEAVASPARHDEGHAAPEQAVARDIAKRALPVAPLLIGLAALVWGGAGAASAAYGIALVVANFLLAAWVLATAARINETILMAAALFGYLVRLAMVAAAVLLVQDAAWVEPPALGLTLVVTHLGLLAWELRYVSASLAHPGLKPVKARATRAGNNKVSASTATASTATTKESASR